MSIEGVDYAYAPHPSAAGLAAAGKHFVCRYGGPGSPGKQLTATERDALFAAGLSIVANAEGAANGLLGGRPVGLAWAASARDHFGALGMPVDRPIYFSADFDCSAGQWPAVREGLRGAASVIGADRVGVYGSYDVMRWAAADKVAVKFWQSYAWSGGRWFAGNDIEQYHNGVTVAGADVDLCRAMTADYGQWGESMPLIDDKDFQALAFRVEALVAGRDTVIGGPTKGEHVLTWQKITDTLVKDPGFLAVLKKAAGSIVLTTEQITQIAGEVAAETITQDEVVSAVKQANREGSGIGS
jgi:hypothetical protein